MKVHKRGFAGVDLYGAMCANSTLWTLYGSKPAARIVTKWGKVTCKFCLRRKSGRGSR